jgi:putative addiction module component (TIGR02574 family)
MGHPARDIFSAALALPEAERLELASHLIASVDAPGEPDWEEAWVDEIDRREQNARDPGAPWSDVRGRVLERLTGR